MLFFVGIMLFDAVSHAEIYIGEGSYVMCEFETLETAKERAKADVIETITANIIKLVEDPHFYPLETVDNLEGVWIKHLITL